MSLFVHDAHSASHLQDAEAPKPMAAGEVSFLGDFDSPYLLNQKTKGFDAEVWAAKVEASEKNLWYPDTEDFSYVANLNKPTAQSTSIVVPSVRQFALAIMDRPRRSIKRLNLFTHGDRTFVGLAGHVRVAGGRATVEFRSGEASVISVNSLAVLSLGFIGKDRKHKDLSDLRTQFVHTDAAIFLYSCFSGVDLELQREIAAAFQVKVVGFKERIEFCPRNEPRPRIMIGIGECDLQGVEDFHALDKMGFQTGPPKQVQKRGAEPQ